MFYVIVAFEHFLLAVKWLIDYIIADVPVFVIYLQ